MKDDVHDEDRAMLVALCNGVRCYLFEGFACDKVCEVRNGSSYSFEID